MDIKPTTLPTEQRVPVTGKSLVPPRIGVLLLGLLLPVILASQELEAGGRSTLGIMAIGGTCLGLVATFLFWVCRSHPRAEGKTA